MRDIVAILNARSTGLGQRFLIRLRHVFERLETTPELYGTLWGDVRAARVRKFQYVVYYVVVPPDRVEVLAVLHGRQHPSTWRDRVD